MRKTKSILCFILLLGIVTIGSAFKKAEITKRDYSDSIKYDYAVMTLWYDVAISSMVIEYDDGRVEDFMKLKKIKNSDLKAYMKRYIMYAFKHLNHQGYELQSCSIEGAIREYYFVRKTPQ